MDSVKNSLQVEITKEKEIPKTVVGRRLVDVGYFFTQLQEISTHGSFDCGLSRIQIINEKCNGLSSRFTLQCKLCNMKFVINNDNPVDKMNLNMCAVAGTLAIGCGHSQMQELSAALDIPLMTEKTFQANIEIIASKWEMEALKSMSEAAEEERCAAVQDGRVNPEGVPVIDVIADGCWGKRSYKKNYSSLSGAAAIIGRKTNKILFMAVKNKYCCICAETERKKEPAREHKCYKNYTGPSTGMESAIILEGFKKSIEMHNLIYGRLISDGDANTYAKLLESRPYANYTIEKIECRNHLLRNLCNKLQSLTTDTRYSVKFRKLITKERILTIRKVIVRAIGQYKNSSDVEKAKMITTLYNDILLAPYHSFGDHSKCKSFFCLKIGQNDIPMNDLFSNCIWNKIILILTNLAAHSRSLIHDVDSNVVERYHSVVAKFVGGKRINFSRRNQYEVRCKAAAISFNTKNLLHKLHKSVVGTSPRNQIKKIEHRRMMKLQKKHSIKRRRLYTSKQDESNYGEQCEKPDMSEEMMEISKEVFLRNLIKSNEEKERILEETVLQSESSEWMELRRNLLTASNFGRVIKRRLNVSCANIVKDILYKESISHVRAIKHGRDHEKIALKQLSEQHGIAIIPCGLYIDEELKYLGASPDGVVKQDDMIVEMKCPISAYKLGYEQALVQKKLPFYKKIKHGGHEINFNHNWYYQIQGQLHITRKSKCLFAIWYGEEFPLTTEIILRDDQFWQQNMERKLTSFYFDCILPELIDPRHTRNMPIRDPPYIEKAIKQKKEKQMKENINCHKMPLREYGNISYDDDISFIPTSSLTTVNPPADQPNTKANSYERDDETNLISSPCNSNTTYPKSSLQNSQNPNITMSHRTIHFSDF